MIRPPTLRITAASPGARPNISTGSTRGSTQPMIMVFIEGMIFRSAEKRLLANASLRWVKVSITLIWMFASILARLRMIYSDIGTIPYRCQLFNGTISYPMQGVFCYVAKDRGKIGFHPPQTPERINS